MTIKFSEWQYGGIQNVNIKFWGAVGDGITDDSAAFLAFQAWAQAQTGTGIVLIIPPGVYSNPTAGLFWIGISNLVIKGYGATLTNFSRGGAFFQNALGINSARINSTVQGDTAVTLVNPALSSIFTNGNWVCINSLQLQDSGGYPPNWYNFEYRQITNINALAGIITLDRALRYAHLSTYPSPTLADSISVYDTGGPASIFNMQQNWVQNIKVIGLTLNEPAGGQTQLTGKYMEFVDVNFIAPDGVAPSTCEHIIFKNCNFTQGTEVDKDITLIECINCKIFSTWLIQSASVDRMVLDGCELLGLISNTSVRNLHIRNSYIRSIQIGSGGFGPGGNIVLENNRIDEIDVNFGNLFLDLTGDVTFSNGTFTIPNTSTQIRNAHSIGVPGTKCFLAGTGIGSPPNWGYPFVIMNARDDAVNTYIDTTLTALPSYSVGPPDAGSPVSLTQFRPNPCSRLTAFNNVGCSDIVYVSKAQKDSSLYSYARLGITGNIVFPPGIAISNIFGALVSIKINVIRAYTGAQPTLNFNFVFGTFLLDQTTSVWTRWAPTVNIKTAGERIITPGSVTGSVAGDSIPVIGAVWFPGTLSMSFDANISADNFAQWPIIDFEIITDQQETNFSAFQFGTRPIIQ